MADAVLGELQRDIGQRGYPDELIQVMKDHHGNWGQAVLCSPRVSSLASAGPGPTRSGREQDPTRDGSETPLPALAAPGTDGGGGRPSRVEGCAVHGCC
jgi:hypothetical protein